MKYQAPTDNEAVDLLDPHEFSRYSNDERGAVRAGRRKAWAEHRAAGPSGRLRELACGDVGATIVLDGYARTGAVSPLIAYVSEAEGVRFTSRIERSLVDGSIIGVRVTLAAFTR